MGVECKTEYVKHCENNKRAKRGMLQGAQECRGGVRRLRSSAIKALQPDSRIRRGDRGEGLPQGELAKGGEDLRQGGHFGLLEISLPRGLPWLSRSDLFGWL